MSTAMNAIHSTTEWHDCANALLKSITGRYNDQFGLGTMSASTYDTAWVSLVSRDTGGGQDEWVFPNSFQYILDAQSVDGGWGGDGSLVDAIVNTLACLLSLKRHETNWNNGSNDISERVEKAISYLNQKLQSWDVPSTERIAFEVIVPSHLELLEKEGLRFEFPQRDILFQLNQRKLSKVNFAFIYKYHSTVLRSLEAFVGKIEFDRLVHHKRNGSLMASPSSTAAYLMYASQWDDEAEQYLHHVIEQCKSYGHGAVCNVWPTTIFEFAWTICNFFESRLDPVKLDQLALDRISTVLHRALTEEDGIIGFAPGVGPDSDDSAKVIAALHFLGRPFPIDNLLKTFELPNHFQCFAHERNPSFSANCNVLLALLRISDPAAYASQVEKAATFITQEWWSTEGVLADKWHLSEWYPAMLASQGLMRLIYLHGKGAFKSLPRDLIEVKIPITLFQILLRILESQREEGSWGVNGSREETAYAILALANLASLPYVDMMLAQVSQAVARGREWLSNWRAVEDMHIVSTDFIWVGKIGYGIEHVCNSYVVSAMHIPIPLYGSGETSAGAPHIVVEKVNKFAKFYSGLQVFKNYPTWRIKGWLIEAYLYLPELSRVRFEVFDRSEMKDDSYFEYLPFFWTAPSAMVNAYTSAQTIFDMSVLAMLNFQIDEFFDIMVMKHGSNAVMNVRKSIGVISTDLEDRKLLKPQSLGSNGIMNKSTKVVTNGTDNDISNHTSPSSLYAAIYDRLFRFVHFILSYPRVQRSSDNDKCHLLTEIKEFLLANAAQCEDNLRLQAQEFPDLVQSPPSSYFKWVRSTATDHLSSKYFMSFIACLLGHGANSQSRDTPADYWRTAELKYIAADCVTHISVISRIYNDFGSLRRDREEGNLNAAFFPEFEAKLKSKTDARLKKELVGVADYERRCLKMSLEHLLHVAQDTVGETQGNRLHQVVRLFYNASEIYNGIYELKDISTEK